MKRSKGQEKGFLLNDLKKLKNRVSGLERLSSFREFFFNFNILPRIISFKFLKERIIKK